MTDLTPGSRWLLPVTFDDHSIQYEEGVLPSGMAVLLIGGEATGLIPASTLTDLQAENADVGTLRHYLTEVIDYLEALGDALTLMPPEMRDPRDLADEIREMLS